MTALRDQAKTYLPDEFIRIAAAFHETCWRRAGTYFQAGGCTPILTEEEEKLYIRPDFLK